jgi:hypothetical protein
VTYAFGHGHLGTISVQMTGKVVADLVAGRPPSVDIVPFSAAGSPRSAEPLFRRAVERCEPDLPPPLRYRDQRNERGKQASAKCNASSQLDPLSAFSAMHAEDHGEQHSLVEGFPFLALRTARPERRISPECERKGLVRVAISCASPREKGNRGVE